MKTALLFPGQGSQWVGMGRDLAEAFPEARELFREADELLGVPLSRICWEGPEEELTRTDNAQPALLVHGYAVWRLLRERLDGSIVVAAGHSLGEFTAHLAAGTFSFPAALRVVRRRGELMARASGARSGTMAAVLGLEEAVVAELCREVEDGIVVPANHNAPGQVVISGDVRAVERASALAAERGARRVLPLNVSGAFHSPLMEEARAGLREALDEVEVGRPAFPVVSNAWARPVTDGAEVRRSLVEQLTSPVRWAEGVRIMRSLEPERWLELGPGSVLAGLVRRTEPDVRPVSIGETDAVRTFPEGGSGD